MARTATTSSMTEKYWFTSVALAALKPLSITRRTAIGTMSVAAAATIRAISARATRLL